MKQREVISFLESKGYVLVRSNGHHIYSNGQYSVAVPHHKDIATGTLRDIFKVVFKDHGLANQKMREFRNKGAA